ncbi:MAG: hypothetical protein K8R69_00780 [Deltaproteobacteria bacterium]|nr:hypothetical protein [Deltaproteobacteria bacterium]
MNPLQRKLFLFLTFGLGIAGLLTSCAGAEAPGAPGSETSGGLGEVSSGNLANSPPLSIPAPVSRTNDPDSKEPRRECHAKVKFKVALTNNILGVNCGQLNHNLHLNPPTVTVAMTSGTLDGTLGAETEHETQCLANGAWYSAELPLTGLLDLKGDCRISLTARMENPSGAENPDKSVTVDDFSDSETKEVLLRFP